MVRLRKLLLGSLMLALVLSLAACGSSADTSKGEEADSQESEEIVVKHQLGETKVKKNPKNVVVFDFGVLDSLDKLGVEVAGVPQANIPPYLKKYGESKYANVGSLKEPDFEKVSSLGPELIIISARQADQYEEFSKIAPTIFMGVDTSRYMESFTENMETLGKIFGKEAEVEKELKAINETIEKVKKKASASDKKALIILTTGGKTSAFGPGSRFGLIHDVLGVKPVDYLFVVDRDKVVSGEGGQPAEQVLNNDLVKGTKAYKDKNIVYLDPNYWYLSGGGLVSLGEMVKEVEAGLQ